MHDTGDGLTDGIADQAELEPSSPGTYTSRYHRGEAVERPWKWWEDAVAGARLVGSFIRGAEEDVAEMHVRELRG